MHRDHGKVIELTPWLPVPRLYRKLLAEIFRKRRELNELIPMKRPDVHPPLTYWRASEPIEEEWRFVYGCLLRISDGPVDAMIIFESGYRRYRWVTLDILRRELVSEPRVEKTEEPRSGLSFAYRERPPEVSHLREYLGHEIWEIEQK